MILCAEVYHQLGLGSLHVPEYGRFRSVVSAALGLMQGRFLKSIFFSLSGENRMALELELDLTVNESLCKCGLDLSRSLSRKADEQRLEVENWSAEERRKEDRSSFHDITTLSQQHINLLPAYFDLQISCILWRNPQN